MDKHNEYRALHGAPPLVESKTLTAYAKDWAKNIAREDTLHDSTLDFRDVGQFGVNIWSVSGCGNLNVQGEFTEDLGAEDGLKIGGNFRSRS